MSAFRHVCVRLLLLAALPLALARPARASAETGARWHTFTTLNGLAGDTVQAIWEDPRGRIWFGTENGACSYDGARWQIYRTADGLVDNNVWSISGDADNTWFATSSGLTRLFHGQWERFSTADGLPSNDVRAVLAARDGTVWVGTFGAGIARRRPGEFLWEKVDLSSIIPNRDVAVQSIWQASSGAIWFGTSAFGALRDYVRTDLSRDELLQLAGQAAWLKPDDLGRITIDPGMLTTLDKPATFALKPEALREIVGELLGQGERRATEARETAGGAGQSSALRVSSWRYRSSRRINRPIPPPTPAR